MTKTNTNGRAAQKSSGFSLIEMLVVVAVLMIITGAIFEQINNTQKTAVSEQDKMDLFKDEIGRAHV